ncbi:Bug family tripartite tricarboxylate transporter substrate binding protein [Roseitranquillus sediminis]|uniref:Bug family tripartite tricarboxylate transporter substrate binding protein n=1 Tax=Roseitranquillus sediminis TaxID=2809051 RepID=UPI001D0C30BF|nr:tripartite tricarboxylate transporter substrate binding protein [Roseitranquillus sediminis]MBM9592996.1 tripartite tricarboxylate transporter substrate binding protein [Roseitranquillus sediminis]
MNGRMTSALAVTAGLALAGTAHAQEDFPQQPVTIVVPFSPGGSNDIVARQLGQQLQELWGEPVVIENRPGGGATIGSAYLAEQDPDGYTLMIASVTFTMNAAVQSELPYDSREDFTPIALIGQVPLVIGARPDIPAETPQELITYLQESDEPLSYGATGVGSIQHFAGELFNQAAGTEVQVIQYPGGAPAMTDVMGGHIEYSIGSMTQMKPQIDEGNIKGIAVTSLERSDAMPDLPTLAESGLEDFEVIQWWAILGPDGMDQALVDEINEDINQVLSSDAFTEFLAADGGTPRPMSAQETADFMTRNFDRWAQVAEEAGIREE